MLVENLWNKIETTNPVHEALKYQWASGEETG